MGGRLSIFLLKKICSREEWFIEDAEKAIGWLLGRGYKKVEVSRALEKVKKKNRWEMITNIETNRTKPKNRVERETHHIPIVIIFNQHNKKIKKVLQNRQPLLNSAFKKTVVRPRITYRRLQNLNDLLIQKGLRGPIESGDKALNIFTQCAESPKYKTRCPCKGNHKQDRCRYCMHSMDNIENIQLRLDRPVNCNTKNIIYMIGYRKCSKKYVGETQQRLKDRLAQHMYNIDKLNQPLYLYFRYKHKTENLYISILEMVKGTEPFFRKVRESWWINHLQSLTPNGLNAKLDCNQIYTEE